MAKVPAPPPIGTIVKSHIALPDDYGNTYPVDSLFRLIDVRTYHAQGSHGYWAIEVEHVETKERITTYDDYFKKGHSQLAAMDVTNRICLFP